MNLTMLEKVAEINDGLNKITVLQAEVIGDLFQLLAQYMTVEELDGLPVIEKINEAARIRKEIGPQ